MFLYQPTSGYCYNSDSLFLYQFIARFKPRGHVLDVGCGVGILSLLVTRDFGTITSIIDKQEVMLRYAKHNFMLNGLEAQSHLEDFIHFESAQKYDFVISNPPFYDASVMQSDNTHLNIARYAHHLPIEAFVSRVKKCLKPRGYFIFCYDAKQVDKILYYLTMYGINAEVMQFVHAKKDRESKLVMVAARMGSKSMMQILPPFVALDEAGLYMHGATQAFLKANTYSIKGDF